MSDFVPRGILEDIFSKLPLKNIGQCRCVCKSWREVTMDPLFCNMLLLKQSNKNYKVMYMMDRRFYSMNFETFRDTYVGNIDCPPWEIRRRDQVKIWGSSNGIILLTTFRAEYLYLWNPYTGECKKIRQVDKQSLPLTHNSMYSIGYNVIAADYQIIHISTSDFSHAKVEVYSLKNPSWRRIQDIPYYSISSTMEKFVNGALHWLATRLQTRQIVIIAYVLETEKFIEIPLPDSIDVNPVYLFVFENGTLDAYLCTIIHYKNAAKQQQTKVWIMKDYGVRESWMELFQLDGNLSPICCIRGGADIVLHYNQRYFIYDTNDKSLRDFSLRGGKEISSHMTTTTYIESIVPLPL